MATGNSLIAFEATENQALAGAAPFGTRNGHPVLRFHPDIENNAIFSGWMPRHYSGLGITARVMWTCPSAGSGAYVAWLVLWERHDPATDLDATSFTAGGFAYSAAPAVAGAPQFIELSSPPAPDGILAGEHFSLQIIRVAGDDNLPDWAELHSIELREGTAAAAQQPADERPAQQPADARPAPSPSSE